MSGTLACRVAGAARYEDAALRAVFGGNLESLVPDDPLLVGLYADLHGAIGEILQGCDASQAMSLARLTCNVRDDHPYSETLSAIAASLDRLETVDHSRDHRSAVGRPLIAVASAALTPEQPVPDVAGWPAA
jgi:hypothetical protein